MHERWMHEVRSGTQRRENPREGIIYYDAGGTGRRVDSQNMRVYPSAGQAKLTECGVVLNGFLDRG